MKTDDIYEKNLMVRHYAGSHAYGTNIATSDVDVRGIFCAEEIQVRAPFFPIRECKIQGEDTSFYELSNYCKLAADNNPNVLETLWVDESDIIETTPEYQLLRDNRDLFLCSKIAFTTTGYATAQLKRIKGRKKRATFLPELNKLCEVLRDAWQAHQINRDFIIAHCGEKVYGYFLENFNPEYSNDSVLQSEYTSVEKMLEDYKTYIPYESLNNICKPKQSEFVKMVQYFGETKMLKFNFYDWVEGHRLIPYGNDIYGIYEHTDFNLCNKCFELNNFFNDDRSNYKNPIMIVKFNDKQYQEARQNYRLFWEWYENRNDTRLEMEKKYSYDTKHAMHLVRLMRIGEEALVDHVYNVKREDAKELLDIRNGKWSYEKIIDYAEEKDEYIRGKLYKETTLRKLPDLEGISKVIIEIQNMFWNKEK